MMLNVSILCICFFNLYLIANAIGNGMRELKLWDNAIRQVESVKIEAERNCATGFDFSFDSESFLLHTELSELNNKAMNEYCGGTFAAISDLCVDADYYGRITSVKSVSCAFDNSIAKPSTTLEAGHLQFAFNWGTSNHRNLVKDYLKKNL